MLLLTGVLKGAYQYTAEKWCRLFVGKRARNKRCTMTQKSGVYLNAVKKASVLKDEHGKVASALKSFSTSKSDNHLSRNAMIATKRWSSRVFI